MTGTNIPLREFLATTTLYLLPGTSVLPNVNIYNLAVPCYPSYTPGKYYILGTHFVLNTFLAYVCTCIGFDGHYGDVFCMHFIKYIYFVLVSRPIRAFLVTRYTKSRGKAIALRRGPPN